ncbi:MAG: glycosyltransferase family 2 protein [Anaerolineales bacterium]|nr:glycosyltransferase family 2 protein [Anaerolineales bacterium]
MTTVAVVILTYNSQPFLEACLASLPAQQPAPTVVVADNASPDTTAAWVSGQHPEVRLLELGGNWGFAGGYNRALAQVDADWFVLLNPDARLAPGWLAALLAFAADHPQAAILGGKLLFDRPAAPGPRTLQSAGALVTNAGTAFEIGWGEPDQGQHDQARPTAAIPGAALLIRRAVWEALGGFDAEYFAYLEDVDLCWRAWLAGHEIWYVPAAEAWHYYGAAAGGRASSLRVRLMQRNRLANMVKHLEAGTLLSGLVTSTAYDVYRMLEFAARGRWAGLRALAAGTGAFSRALPGLLAQRRRLQSTRRRTDADLRRRGLLVPAWAAFREYRRLAGLARSRDR